MRKKGFLVNNDGPLRNLLLPEQHQNSSNLREQIHDWMKREVDWNKQDGIATQMIQVTP
jgi:hypothetical protein